MKSRISSSNLTAFRKDLTRFAPLWGLYLIGGLLVMLTALSSDSPGNAAKALGYTIGPFSVINLIYAGLVALFLFGDLFTPRMCNALHAMPLRREHWFLSHIAAGFLYSLVPNFIGVLCMLPLLGSYWYVGFLWLLGMELEFLFFFALAVLCVFCAGNRLGMAAMYAILNFGSLILLWFLKTIYEPLLFGIRFPEEPFLRCCPVVWMSKKGHLVDVTICHVDNYGSGAYYEPSETVFIRYGEGWGYVVLCAVIGLALMGLGLLLYRRRKLECAGDLIAVKRLEPVFSVVFTLCAGCVFALFAEIFGMGYLPFLAAGMIVGFFTGQMLLRRTVKVFRPRVFGGMALLILIVAATIGLTAWDPCGITTYVPETEEVTKAEIHLYSSEALELTDPDSIRQVTQIHQKVLEQRLNSHVYYGSYYTKDITIRYTLKSGAAVSREYEGIWMKPDLNDMLTELYTTPEAVFGCTDWDTYVSGVKSVTLRKESYGYNDSTSWMIKDYPGLLEAVRQDCEAGTMAQDPRLENYGENGVDNDCVCYLKIRQPDGNLRTVSITQNDVHTLAWLRENRDQWDPFRTFDFSAD